MFNLLIPDVVMEMFTDAQRLKVLESELINLAWDASKGSDRPELLKLMTFVDHVVGEVKRDLIARGICELLHPIHITLI